MITTQTADSVLKSYYLGVVSDQLDKTVNPLLAEIKKTASDIASNPLKRRVLRRQVARMLTVLRERELQENK